MPAQRGSAGTSSPGLPEATHPLAYRRERRRQVSYNSRAAPTHSYAAGCPGRGLGTCHPGPDKVHRPHHMPREPGPEPSARLASPAPAPPPACCAHPPEPPGRGRLPQPLSGVLGRATTQQGRRQSPGVARSSLNQRPPQGPPKHSGVLAPDTGAPCPQLDSATVLHPFSFSTPALGRPQGGSTTVGSVVGAERSRNHGEACIRLPPLPGRARQAGLQPQLPGVSGRSLGPHMTPRKYSPATLIGPRARGCHLRAGGEQPAAARGMAGGNPAGVGGPWAGGMEQRGSGAGWPRLQRLQAPMPGALLLLWG